MDKDNNKYSRLLWVLTTILAIIGIAIVVRRLLFLNDLQHGATAASNLTKSRSPVPDAGFAEHPLLTFVHIVPALLFVLLAPWQLVKTVRRRYPGFIRISAYIVLACGLVIGCTALTMGFIMAIGGIVETLAVAVFGTAFIFSVIKSWLYLVNGDATLYREWMIRVLAIGLAVSTTRPIVALFFATSRFTGLHVQQYFGASFWIAFTLHVIVAEWYIRRTRLRTTPITNPHA